MTTLSPMPDNKPMANKEQDSELQQLCQQVVEATGWGIKENTPYLNRKWSRNGIGEWYVDIAAPMIFQGQIPLYTSDYLLTKLPPSIKEGEDVVYLFGLHPNYSSSSFTALYMDMDTKGCCVQCFGRTPLEALLKLTLALHKAGELQEQDKEKQS